MSIENKFPKNPADIVYVALLFMQKWAYFSRKTIVCAALK
jgi:hypothetical protein